MKIITKQMIEDGLNQGIIRPVLEDYELICNIGDFWFYFGQEFEDIDPKYIPFDILVNEILSVLDEFREIGDVFEDEYLYYYYYLTETIR